jgi:Fe(3+) dicitrate transport protein
MDAILIRRAVGLACLMAFSRGASADNAQAGPGRPSATTIIDSMTVIGSAVAARDIGGSAHFVGPEELEKFEYADIHRVLRAVPGVYLQDEEGFGHRPNIGIRGSGQDRSSRVAVLEDGVLMAPAPYSAPAAYHFPNTRRIHAVEVLKGPSSILIGPRTIGGAINLLSTPIPDGWGAKGDYFFGGNNSHDAHIYAGGSGDHFGILLETVQMRSDGFKTIDDNERNTKAGYDIDDWLVKGRIGTAPGATVGHILELKYGRSTQDAQQSYLGLTDEDFAANPFRLYAATQIDQLDTDFTMRQASWAVEPAARSWRFILTRYDNEFERSWYRVNNVAGVGLSAILENPDTFPDQLAWLKGANSPDDALRARDNARSYESKGWQGQGEYDFSTGMTEVTLKAGVRLHEDLEDRFQTEDRYRMENGNLVLTTAGVAGGQDIRVGLAEARSGFVSADIYAGSWRLSPGMRYERIELSRRNYAPGDATRAMPLSVSEQTVTKWITGIGATYALTDRVKLIGGVHEGFNPPAPGSTASAETSTNWEAGIRYSANGYFAEAIAFVTDYGNLVGTVTESTGGGGEIGDQFEAGKAIVRGLETLVEFVLWDFGGWQVPSRLVWTWTPDAEFRNSFASNFAPWGTVTRGDRMPYVPEHVAQWRLGLEGDRLALTLNFNYQAETRTRAGQGAIPFNERTDSALVVDVGGSWQMNSWLSLEARVENLFDKHYIASRSPSGARPGIDRWIMAGLKARF